VHDDARPHGIGELLLREETLLLFVTYRVVSRRAVGVAMRVAMGFAHLAGLFNLGALSFESLRVLRVSSLL
jgi:hypothetical protein